MNEGNFENIEKMMRIDEGRWKMKKSWKNEGRRREPMKYEEDTLGKYLFCLNLAKRILYYIDIIQRYSIESMSTANHTWFV